MRRALLVVLLTLGLGLGSGAVGQANEKPSLPEQAADRAREALADAKAARHGKGRDLTMALIELFKTREDLSGRERQQADAILARPTHGASDPQGDGYPAGAPVQRYCTTNVCIHYVASGAYDDAPPLGNANGNAYPDWVEGTGSYMQSVWNSEVNAQGYRAPAADGGRGGDNRLDVYLSELTNDGLYGYCAAEYVVPGTQRRASGYCVLDDDFVGYNLPPVPSLKATAAHEFFHMIQFNFDYLEDKWIQESTATWMEEQVFTEVNDNRVYLPHGQLGRPTVSLDTFENEGLAQYGNWIFFERMEKDFGAASIKALWQRMGEDGGDQNSVEALTSYIAARNNTLAGYYRGFAAGNVVPKTTYPEGAAPAYKEAPGAAWHTLSKATDTTTGKTIRLNHLANANIEIVSGTPNGAAYSKLQIILNLPDAANSGNFVVAHKSDGTKAFYAITLNASGDGAITVPFSDATVNRITLTLANGHATANNQPFSYKATAVA